MSLVIVSQVLVLEREHLRVHLARMESQNTYLSPLATASFQLLRHVSQHLVQRSFARRIRCKAIFVRQKIGG